MVITFNNSAGDDFNQHYTNMIQEKIWVHDNQFIPLMAGYLGERNKLHQLEFYQDCRQQQTITRYLDKNNKPHYGTHTWFSCHDRFCPICSMQMAKENKHNIAYVLRLAKKDFTIATLRLSRPNVKGYDIRREVKQMAKAFNRMMKRRGIQRIVTGYIKKLETSYNDKKNNYNVHYHILLVLKQDYFTDKNNINWSNQWREVNSSIQAKAYFQAHIDLTAHKLYTLANYYSKPPLTNYNIDQQIFNDLYVGFKQQKILTYSGYCKQMLRKKVDSYEKRKRINY